MGGVLADNQETSEYYYISGALKENPNSTYGNVYLVDDDGNEIYIYGLYDMNGNRYDSMSNKPYKGDRVIVYSRILKYVNATETKIELKNAILIEIK